jgi:hypothetical protein
VVKEDKDDRYGSEAIECGFIFQIIRSANETRTSGACSDTPSSEMLRAREKRYFKIVTFPSRCNFYSGFDRTANEKPDEGGSKTRTYVRSIEVAIDADLAIHGLSRNQKWWKVIRVSADRICDEVLRLHRQRHLQTSTRQY